MADDDDDFPMPTIGEDREPGLMKDGKDPKRFKKQKQRSKRQENRVASQMGGRRSSTSGAVRTKGYSQKGVSGDVRAFDKGFLVEAKYTDAKSFRITEDVLIKAASEALAAGQDWVVSADINGFDSSLISQSIAILDWDTFLQLIEKAQRDD